MKRIKTSPTMYVGKVGTYELIEGNKDTRAVGFTRVWAMPNHETFKIKPIAKLLTRYVGTGKRWVDPFAGNNSPAEWTNDHNPKTSARFHLEAVEFSKRLRGKYQGVIFDPPYSFRQVSEHYRVLGKKATAMDTSARFYEKVKTAICEKIKPGGWAISFGWNSNGFGKARDFHIVEILLVSHGGTKNDTIVVIEQKALKI
jgi:hypothetical protein